MSEGLFCSFCGKAQDDVRHLLQGPCAYCCDECVDLMHGMIVNADRDGRSIRPKPPKTMQEFRDSIVALKPVERKER